MTEFFSFFQHTIIKIRRFRHRNGYGVHSPFAYNLIKGVFYEKSRYYAYSELASLRRGYKGRLAVTGRSDRLMFRLANYVRPDNVAITGTDSGVTGEYIAAGCKKARITYCANAGELSDERADFCYVAPGEDFLEVYRRFAVAANEKSVFVAAGIHRTSRAAADWKAVCADELSIVTFDLYEVGIAFFNKKYNKQNYIVSF